MWKIKGEKYLCLAFFQRGNYSHEAPAKGRRFYMWKNTLTLTSGALQGNTIKLNVSVLPRKI